MFSQILQSKSGSLVCGDKSVDPGKDLDFLIRYLRTKVRQKRYFIKILRER